MGVEFAELERFIFDDCNEDGSLSGESFDTDEPNGNYVKHSLKSKILERRESQGLGKITVDFSPKQNYPLTEIEKEKDRKRKESNRISAKKCREKQKEDHKRNKMLLEQLREDQQKLLSRVQQIEEEKNKVMFALKKILPDSYILETLNQNNYHELRENAVAKDNLETIRTIEQTQLIQNEEQDLLHITNEQNMHEDEHLGSETLFSCLIGDQGDEVETVDQLVNFEIGNDILLSIFTQ